MDEQLAVICALTFGIQLIGALAYAARIAGVRTGKIAMSFALFNVPVLLSRLSNGFLGPFLASPYRECARRGLGRSSAARFPACASFRHRRDHRGHGDGANRPALVLKRNRAVPGVSLDRSPAAPWLCPGGVGYLKHTTTPPKLAHLTDLAKPRGVSLRVILLNVVAQALLTVGVIASLYAGYLYPEYRVTAPQLSAVVNGMATLMLFILIDPQLSIMTDDVVAGKVSEPVFRRTIVWLLISRVGGSMLAQVLFLPAALLVVAAAKGF